MNRLPKTGQDKRPYEIFTGKEVDYLRDLRAEWGEILLVKNKAAHFRFECNWRVGSSIEENHEWHRSAESLLGAVKEISLQIAFQKSKGS